MKKVISLILAAIMLVCSISMFASCADDNGDSEGSSENTDPAASSVVKVIDIGLTEEEYAFAVQKGDTEMLNALNTFMAKITADGTMESIMNKYFAGGEPTPVKSAASMKTDGSQLIVATNAAFEPFEYMKGDNYYGVDMEIMNLFAKELGKELYINNMEFDAVCLSVSAAGGTYTDDSGVEHSVTGGVCNIAAAGLTVSDTRKQILDFSTSYYNASQMVIVAADDTTFDNCKAAADVETILKAMTADTKVGVQNGTTGQKYGEGDADWGFDGFAFSTVGYANGALAVQDILNKNIKLVIIDEGPAKAIVKRVNEAN